MRQEGATAAQKAAAEGARLKWDEPVMGFKLDETAATRLGARDVELRFDPPLAGPFGAPVARLAVPDHLNPSGAFEPLNIAQNENGFSFRLSETVFQYDNYGLRRAEAQP